MWGAAARRGGEAGGVAAGEGQQVGGAAAGEAHNLRGQMWVNFPLQPSELLVCTEALTSK